MSVDNRILHVLTHPFPARLAAELWGVLHFPEFANSPDPLALILREINQLVVATILAVSAVVALPTVLLGFLFGQSRIFFTMARDGLLPAKLATVSKRGAPVKITDRKSTRLNSSH